MEISAMTDKGLIRNTNEDGFFSADGLNLPLFIIADGMGGHKAGEVASQMSIDIIRDRFILNEKSLNTRDNIIDTINSVIKEANEKIYLKSLKTPEYDGMGTTLTLAYIFENNIYIGHIGDSRVYYINDENIIQVTEDHSLVNELVKKGCITMEEGRKHPQKNMITRAVGTSIDIEVDIFVLEYQSNDILLLCSDGLSDMLDDKDIYNIVKNSDSMDIISNKLINEAKSNGGLDNITVIGIKL